MTNNETEDTVTIYVELTRTTTETTVYAVQVPRGDNDDMRDAPVDQLRRANSVSSWSTHFYDIPDNWKHLPDEDQPDSTSYELSDTHIPGDFQYDHLHAIYGKNAQDTKGKQDEQDAPRKYGPDDHIDWLLDRREAQDHADYLREQQGQDSEEKE